MFPENEHEVVDSLKKSKVAVGELSIGEAGFVEGIRRTLSKKSVEIIISEIKK